MVEWLGNWLDLIKLVGTVLTLESKCGLDIDRKKREVLSVSRRL